MPLSSFEISRHLDDPSILEEKRFLLAPKPNAQSIRQEGAASVDLRLGTWFVTTRASRHVLLDVYAPNDKQPSEHNITDKRYVPLGDEFILHPRSFVLAATLEWIKMPRTLCGYVTGKSSWGRRGLVIETAPGVHPGFTGCLTLELANVGEIPIKLVTGTKICQLFLHEINGKAEDIGQTSFLGQRQPILGRIQLDEFVTKLIKAHPSPNDLEP